MDTSQADKVIDEMRTLLRARGMRWTPQRRSILEELVASEGHVTGVGLVERVKRRDPETIPSTVYRTLDVLEELGFVRHSHGSDGREEFHVLPAQEHAHLTCERCGTSWDIEARELGTLGVGLKRRRAFLVDVAHLTITGTCADCLATEAAGPAHGAADA